MTTARLSRSPETGIEPSTETSSGSTSTRAVDRALALLSSVCLNEVTSLADASRRTGVPASTALRLLRTMEREHFVVRDADAGWRAGPRLLQLAVRSLAREPLARLARASLARLTVATGESAYLSVRGSDGLAVHVAAGEGTHPIRYAAWVGHTVPLDGSAVGAALDGTVGDDGYAARQPAGEPDVTQVSAPIRRPGGIIAALSIIGPAYRMDATVTPALGALVVAEAARLQAALGVPESNGPDPRSPDAYSSDQTRPADNGPHRDDPERVVAG
jgi:IclR family transcriptional regulator, acetate operon repressor